MTVLQVPTFSDPSWTQATTLEGTRYTLQFDFNQRCASWYMSVADQDGVDIYNGVKLTIGPLLLKKCVDPRRPPGDFLVITSVPANTSPPGMLDLLPGGRCTLGYITSDWLTVIRTANANPTPANIAAVQALFTQIQAGGTATSPISTYGQG